MHTANLAKRESPIFVKCKVIRNYVQLAATQNSLDEYSMFVCNWCAPQWIMKFRKMASFFKPLLVQAIRTSKWKSLRSNCFFQSDSESSWGLFTRLFQLFSSARELLHAFILTPVPITSHKHLCVGICVWHNLSLCVTSYNLNGCYNIIFYNSSFSATANSEGKKCLKSRDSCCLTQKQISSD